MDGERIVHDVAERVRQIVSEAEQKAAEIVRDAEADAKRIREQAEAQGRARLEEVREALDDLQGRIGSATKGSPAEAEIDPGPVIVPEPEPPAVPEPEPPPAEPIVPPAEPEPEPAIVPEPAPAPDEGDLPSAVNGTRSGDDAAARLVAMNLALEGVSREQAKQRLAADYEIADLDSLVDEVYARAVR